jgi:predicted nuclease of predicted toxin-antitoxin system
MQFLVDVNLPKKFSFFHTPDFQFVVDLDRTMTDSAVWEYALEHELVILTKDVDYYLRFLGSEQKAKVVYFRLGNKTLSALHEYFEQNWERITDLLAVHSLVIAYIDHFDCL